MEPLPETKITIEREKTMKKGFLPFSTLFECPLTGKISYNQIDLLPRSLTLDPNFISPWHYRNQYNTLFKELKIVPPEKLITPEIASLFKEKTGSHKMSKEHLLMRCRFFLNRIVRQNWKPQMFHVILSSSGLDSRMLSFTIRQVYKKFGNKWLGKIMFLSNKWEAPHFKRVMKFQGWKSSQFWVVDEKLNPREYYAPDFLNFNNVWRMTNGPASKLDNRAWYCVERAQKKGLIPTENIQEWTAEWGNVAWNFASAPKKAGSGLRNEWERRYMSYPCAIAHPGDELIQPFAHIELTRYIIESSVRLHKALRPDVLHSMDSRLANLHRAQDLSWRQPPCAKWILKQMLKDYNSSWYGKTIRSMQDLPERNRHDPRWSYFSSASFCEHLLKQGYKIKIEK